jgi:formylglycine-generating enzyme required for sulfatase activity
VDLRDYQNWWNWLPGAGWRHPEGPSSSLDGRDAHPVVHVAWEDVEAYARWAGKQLPTEAEWEFAARGALDDAEYAWGDEFYPGGIVMANTWEGEFPWQNGLRDGYERTSPVGVFPANPYGLYDIIGNVWEWTQDWYRDRHLEDAAKPCCIPQNPRGPSQHRSYDPAQPAIRIPRKVLKGGSHLCAPNYCRRYRPAARMPQQIDTGTSNIGFRLIVRAASPAKGATR